SDEASHELRDRISKSLAGTRVRDLERLGADVLAGVLPRIYPQVLALAYEHQDAGRRVYIVTAASQELADTLAHVLALDGAVGSQFSEVRDGVYTGHPTGLFVYGNEKALAIERLARREGLGLGSADAAPGRAPRGGQSRRRAGQGGAGRAVGGAALRPPRAAPEGRGGVGRGGGRGRRGIGGDRRPGAAPAGAGGQA